MMARGPGSKSIIANFGALSASLPEDSSEDNRSVETTGRPIGRVGAGVIGATQRSLAEIREERDRLLALVESGGAIQELDPELIEPSPFPDRLPDDGDAAFEEFKLRFAAEGQKVPVQLRSHPTALGRFQIIYGHRRWRAAKELGLKVRAIVGEFSDSELVLAQGIENSDRQDLSWIERALFVARMDSQDIKPRDIKAALSIDDAELAKLRQVYREVPSEIVVAIGRAPKVGRPRWLTFVGLLADPDAVRRVRETLSADKVSVSDERFQLALSAAKPPTQATHDDTSLGLRGSSGRVIARATFQRGEVRVKIEKQHSAAFASFLRNELPRLVEQFEEMHPESPESETLSADKLSKPE